MPVAGWMSQADPFAMLNDTITTVPDASAVEAGAVHPAEPRAGERILNQLNKELALMGVRGVEDLIGVGVRR